jgi:hypothetical protein
MDRYTHNAFSSTRHDDLLREAATERLARDGRPASVTAPLRSMATAFAGRLALHGNRAHATAKDALAAAAPVQAPSRG